jgi:hypothetical protein
VTLRGRRNLHGPADVLRIVDRRQQMGLELRFTTTNQEAFTHAVSDVWSWHDPALALGASYPLAVFMKYGRVNTELLVN